MVLLCVSCFFLARGEPVVNVRRGFIFAACLVFAEGVRIFILSCNGTLLHFEWNLVDPLGQKLMERQLLLSGFEVCRRFSSSYESGFNFRNLLRFG